MKDNQVFSTVTVYKIPTDPIRQKFSQNHLASLNILHLKYGFITEMTFSSGQNTVIVWNRLDVRLIICRNTHIRSSHKNRTRVFLDGTQRRLLFRVIDTVYIWYTYTYVCSCPWNLHCPHYTPTPRSMFPPTPPSLSPYLDYFFQFYTIAT